MIAKRRRAEKSPFDGLSMYVSQLQSLADAPHQSMDWDLSVNSALNGQVGVEMRRVIPLETQRKFGAFFTGTDLASRLIGCAAGFDANSIFYDPTCGMGDLLLSAARHLPICASLSDTLNQWGRQLTGTDIHSEFVEGAKIRLILLARQRHGASGKLKGTASDYFPDLRVANAFEQEALFDRATHLLLNPPFGQAAAPSNCEWAGGRTTEAAAFVMLALERSKPGTELLAVLPEVLRSGSFSEQWRKRINQLASIRLIQPYGIFDDNTDVDVFLLHLNRRGEITEQTPYSWISTAAQHTHVISNFFDVHVGRVVPHRDEEAGPLLRYIHPRNIAAWVEITRISEKRRHKGLTYYPPFVAIRRTSRPGHPYRAAATIILGKEPVAVENHLIVCEPHDKSVEMCRVLMEQLHTQKTNEFLDERIRCRHLTVGAVASIPFVATTNPLPKP